MFLAPPAIHSLEPKAGVLFFPSAPPQPLSDKVCPWISLATLLLSLHSSCFPPPQPNPQPNRAVCVQFSWNHVPQISGLTLGHLRSSLSELSLRFRAVSQCLVRPAASCAARWPDGARSQLAGSSAFSHQQASHRPLPLPGMLSLLLPPH